MSPVTNIKSRPIFAWIPPNSTTEFKVTVEARDGSIIDISDRLSSYLFEDYTTDSIGNFEFTIYDPNSYFYRMFRGNEIVRYYKDYAADATTLRFRGRIEKPSKRGYKLNVRGRSESLAMFGPTVTKNFVNTECSVILKSIFGSYLTQFTLNNVNVSTKSLTVNWYQKNFFECVKDLCIAAGFECYIDANLDVHYFLSGSNNNSDEAIIHEYNLTEIGDFTPDLTLIRNRVIVYGAIQQGIQIIATAESDDPDYGVNSNLGVKEEIVNDDNITNQTQAQEYADFLLDDLQTPPEVGDVTSIMLASTNPGDNIQISSPNDGLDQGYYFTTGYKDEYDNESGKFQTTVIVNKEPRKISHIMKTRVENENKTKQTSINPEEMKYSFNFLFDINSGSHTNTEIIDGILKSTSATGTWISENLQLTSNLTEAYLILNGETLTGAIVSVSGNNGISYQTINNRSKITMSSAIGSNIRVKVEFSNADTQIESLSILYNKE